MVRVGVVGLGMMGLTHLGVYQRHPHVQIAAICDSDPARLSGQTHALGNIEGQSQLTVRDLADSVRRCSDIQEVIGAEEIDLVDICLPTDLHLRFGSGSPAGRPASLRGEAARPHGRAGGGIRGHRGSRDRAWHLSVTACAFGRVGLG